LIPKADPPPRQGASGSGAAAALLAADVGTSLTKFALSTPEGALELRFANGSSTDEIVAQIRSFQPARVGLTGCGAAVLAAALDEPSAQSGEFDAWAAGARALYARAGSPAPERFLLVSVGTGTSAMLVEADGTTRVGGSALGGGTVAGLAAALLGTADFDTIIDQAGQGDRWAVDLPVSEVYPDGTPGLAAINAASFAKLAREPGPRDVRDLASAVLSLVGENIGFICAGLAHVAGVEEIAYGGTTLRRNPMIRQLLSGTAAVHGRRAVFLEDGEFAGAIGALALAER
jgi:type II pantothenate kinase